jgi:exopolyphosphatase/guanosine-5'-triphosphate,3'-diphosphate pyrophosphatase
MSADRVAQGVTFAVVDIGSNTVKVSVYTCFPGIGPVAVLHDADTVRIGYRVAETGAIAPERLERLLDTLRRFEAAARSHRATVFTGVATQAFRIAGNAGDALAAIHAATAWRIRVIDAVEETRLTVEGARPWLEPGERTLVADIGGASTELVAIGPSGEVSTAASVPVGSGLLYDRAIAASPPPPGSLERARDLALEAIDRSGVVTGEASRLLLPGGTGQFLQMLAEQLSPRSEFGPGTLPALHHWLAARSADETMTRIPVQLDRAQVLPASLAVVEALVLRSDPQRLVAIPSGIRDGVARALCPGR